MPFDFVLAESFQLTRGVEVVKSAAALPQTAAATLFTVTGGRVLLLDIMGAVTVQIGAVANATKLQLGQATDICATVEMNVAAVGSVLHITGTPANAMVKAAPAAVIPIQATALVVTPTTIDVRCAGSDGGGGRVKWTIHYIPLEAGATVVAS